VPDVPCPSCKAPIQQGAYRCRHCGVALQRPSAPAVERVILSEPSEMPDETSEKQVVRFMAAGWVFLLLSSPLIVQLWGTVLYHLENPRCGSRCTHDMSCLELIAGFGVLTASLILFVASALIRFTRKVDVDGTAAYAGAFVTAGQILVLLLLGTSAALRGVGPIRF
jgi:hypothetical protein